MRENVLRNTTIAGLILLAGGQGLALWLRQESAPAAGARWLRAGDGLGELDLLDGRGSPVSWPPGRPAVLLVFDPECVHCPRGAAAWAGWIGAIPPGVRVLGVTDASYERGVAFLREQGLEVEMARVPGGAPGGPADALLRRAPWVFVVDEGGSILAEGHDLGAPEVLAALTGAPGNGEGP